MMNLFQFYKLLRWILYMYIFRERDNNTLNVCFNSLKIKCIGSIVGLQ